MKKKSTETFTASNGVKIEYSPELEAAKPLNDAEWKRMKRVKTEAVLSPEYMQAINEFVSKKMRGRPPKPNKKKDIKLRIDPDVLKAFRATGKGWQTRMNDALRHWAEERI